MWLRERLTAIFIMLAALTLIDEVIKEGYAFDPADLLSPQITHEKLFTLFLLLALILGLRRGKQARSKTQ
jgi:succinate dehydrogenase hydrophobic anchor subunit